MPSHNHSKFSVQKATAGVKISTKAKEQGMPAVALTDLGNMYGAFAFTSAAHAAGIKPIIGCELYVVDNRHAKNAREHRDALSNRALSQKYGGI